MPWPDPTRAGLTAAISDRYGPVLRCHPMTVAAGLPPVALVDVEVAATAPTLLRDLDPRAGGAATSYPASVRSGTGEALERYSAGYVPYERLTFGTAADVGAYVTPAVQWALYPPGGGPDPAGGHPDGHAAPASGAGSAQRLRDRTEDDRVGWVTARRLHDDRVSAVPAQCVYLGYVRAPDEPTLIWTTSSGLACAPDLPTAVLRGLLEIVERDAFMRVWRQRLTLPRLPVEGFLERHPTLGRALTLPGGARLALVDLSSVAVAPTVLATVRHPHPELPALAVGAASALTLSAAATKAAVEACHTAQYAAMLRRSELLGVRVDAAVEPPVAGADGFDRHVGEYVCPRRARRADFLDAGPVGPAVDRPDPTPGADATAADPTDAARDLAERWAAEGVEAFAVDVTSPDVAELGLAVARVVSPQAAQLDVAGAGPYLGQPRLRRRPDGRQLARAELNADVHPFP